MRHLISTLFAVLFFSIIANAQQYNFRGIVRDAETQEPLVGASVVEDGTNNGTITNLSGQFELDARIGSTLVISYTGYETQEVVGSFSQMIIDLQPNHRHAETSLVIQKTKEKLEKTNDE